MNRWIALAATLLLANAAWAQAGAGSRWRTQTALPGSRASAFLNLLGNSAAIRYQGIVRPQLQAESTARENKQSLDQLSGDRTGTGFGGGQGGGGGGGQGGGFGGGPVGYGSGYNSDGGAGVGEPFSGSSSRRLYSSGSFAPRPRGLSPVDQGVKAKFLDRGRFFPSLRSGDAGGAGGGGGS